MQKIIFPLFILLASCNLPAEKKSLPDLLSTGKWVDLSYEFSEKTVYWPNNPIGFKLNTQFNGMTEAGFYYASNSFYSPEHGGTHLDAPIHFSKDKWSTDEIPLDNLMGEGVLIDVSKKTENNVDYQIIQSDVEEWEKINGEIPGNSILLFRTGWGKFYPDTEKYLGTVEKGQEATSKLHFPAIHPDLAEWLIKNRKIKAVGIDAASIDYGQSTDFKSHQLFYAENIPGFENLFNLETLPSKGFFIIALPMKIKSGTGGPLRIIAWFEN